MVVHTTKENPFGWIVTYPPSEANSVLSCLQGSKPIANAVQQWAAELAAAVDGSSIDFLMHAWAEVYLTDAGWWGNDASLGLAAAL